VYRSINTYQPHHSVTKPNRGGRKRKTTSEIDEKIIKKAEQQPFTTPSEIKRELQLSVSSRTVRRRLDEKGLHGRVAQHEHSYEDYQITKRLSFANGYSNWTTQQWSQVLFSDETLLVLGLQGRIWVQRPSGTAKEDRYTVKTTSHPPKLSIWACFSYRGVGDIDIFSDTLDAKGLKEIYKKHLIQSAKALFDKYLLVVTRQRTKALFRGCTEMAFHAWNSTTRFSSLLSRSQSD